MTELEHKRYAAIGTVIGRAGGLSLMVRLAEEFVKRDATLGFPVEYRLEEATKRLAHLVELAKSVDEAIQVEREVSKAFLDSLTAPASL